MSSASMRPLPLFSQTDTFLLSKKKRSTPKKVPPRPPCKWSMPITRFSSEHSNKAQAVSFKESDSSILSKHYDESKEESYFDQCFQVFERIGSGSFGDVFKVKSKEDGIYYAVKKSRERFKGKGDRERKLEEVAKHEQLPKHPNVVQFYKAWEEKQCLYIQTELCETNLTDFLESHHDLDETIVWNYLIDLLFAVRHLHERNLIHMDIKPDNIFISRYGVCKLGDFGLMMEVSSKDEEEAMEGDPKYLAKELMQGKFTKAADIFSLGITTLELACDLDLPSGGQSWHQLRSGDIPAELVKNLSEDLRNIITEMMHPEYEKRPTVEELLNNRAIKRLALKRRLSLTVKASLSSSIDQIYRLMYFFFKISFLSQLYEWFKSKLFRNSLNDLKTPPHNSKKFSSRDYWENSFSDDDILDTSRISNGFSTSSENISFTDHSRHTSTAFRNHRKRLESSPCLTPIRRENSLLNERSFKDKTIDGKSSLSQRLNFCDISEDENDNSNIGPKNLLSIFEEIASEEKANKKKKMKK